MASCDIFQGKPLTVPEAPKVVAVQLLPTCGNDRSYRMTGTRVARCIKVYITTPLLIIPGVDKTLSYKCFYCTFYSSNGFTLFMQYVVNGQQNLVMLNLIAARMLVLPALIHTLYIAMKFYENMLPFQFWFGWQSYTYMSSKAGKHQFSMFNT